jgi:hypothetical protein
MKFWAPWREEGRGDRNCMTAAWPTSDPWHSFQGILVFSSALLGQGFALQIENRREKGGKRNENLGTAERGAENDDRAKATQLPFPLPFPSLLPISPSSPS